jgi:hypothetical protein
MIHHLRSLRMLNLRAALFGCAALVIATVPSTAQTVEDLDRRMRVLEENMSRMLLLMEQMNPQPPAIGNGGADNVVPIAPRRMSSRLNLSVCPLQVGSDRRLPQECQGLAPASARVSAPENFGFAAALRQPAIMDFFNIEDGGVVGIRWEGQIQMEKVGEHSFQISLRLLEGRDNPSRVVCRARLLLGGEEIVQAASEFETAQTNAIEVHQGKINLEAATYHFEVFVVCFAAADRLRTVLLNADLRPVLERVRVEISFAEPGDRALKPLPTSRLGTLLQ